MQTPKDPRELNRYRIQLALLGFNHTPFASSVTTLFKTLGYQSLSLLDHELPAESLIQNLEKKWKKDSVDACRLNTLKMHAWQQVVVATAMKTPASEAANAWLVLAIELPAEVCTHEMMMAISGELNRVLSRPVIVLFKYGLFLGLAIPKPHDEPLTDVTPHLIVIAKLRMVCAHRAHLEMLDQLAYEYFEQHGIDDKIPVTKQWFHTLLPMQKDEQRKFLRQTGALLFLNAAST